MNTNDTKEFSTEINQGKNPLIDLLDETNDNIFSNLKSDRINISEPKLELNFDVGFGKNVLLIFVNLILLI